MVLFSSAACTKIENKKHPGAQFGMEFESTDPGGNTRPLDGVDAYSGGPHAPPPDSSPAAPRSAPFSSELPEHLKTASSPAAAAPTTAAPQPSSSNNHCCRLAPPAQTAPSATAPSTHYPRTPAHTAPTNKTGRPAEWGLHGHFPKLRHHHHHHPYMYQSMPAGRRAPGILDKILGTLQRASDKWGT